MLNTYKKKRRITPTLVALKRAPSKYKSNARLFKSINLHEFQTTMSTAYNATSGVFYTPLLYVGAASATPGFKPSAVFAGGGSDTLNLNFSLSGFNIFFATSGAPTTTNVPNQNLANLKALYDQYKINWVEVKFYFSVNDNNTATTAGTPGIQALLPNMVIAKDYNDSAASNIQAIGDYDNAKTWQMGNQRGTGSFTVRLRPRYTAVVNDGGINVSGITPKVEDFIDTDYPDVLHYGLKLAVDCYTFGTGSTFCGTLQIVTTMHYTMKNTK